MDRAWVLATVVAVLSVAIVLMMGLLTMFRGQDANASQRLMRMRVGLQFVAIVVIMLVIYFTRR